MKLKVGKCKGCSCDKTIVNTRHFLCQECNWKRLHPNEQAKVYILKRVPLKSSSPPKRSTKKISQRSKKLVDVLRQDEETYEKVYQIALKQSGCRCENCNRQLDTRFRDEDGRIVQRFRFSHILSKGAYPEFRFDYRNFNFLCLECHQIWEFGSKTTMQIHAKNQEISDFLRSNKLKNI